MEDQPIVLSAAKPRVLMICAHEPTVDPRIRWEAEFAANQFDVTVLGFKENGSSAPHNEDAGSYKIVRLQRFDVSPAYYLWRLKDVLPRQLVASLLVVGVLVYPLLVLGELVVRIFVALGSAAKSLATVALPLSLVKGRWQGRARGSAHERYHYIMCLLRMQFGPAAAIFSRYIDALREKPDVIHCNDLDTLLAGVLAKKRYGCQLVFDAHEFFPVADSLCGWLDTKFFSLVERLLIRHVNAVVTVNPLLADAMRNAYSLSRVYSVPNVETWIDNRPAPAANSRMAVLAGSRLRFLFQGRFTPARGIEEIIRAWSLVDGSKAALFLRGPDNIWRKAAMGLAGELGLLNISVYFLDAVSEDMLVAAAADGDVGIIPYLPLSINERLSCPNKLSQYMHAGLMIISNDLPYVKSVVAAADAGLSYTSKDISTLASAVEQVVRDPQLLRRCRENALRFARDDFNWQVHGKTFLDLYAGNEPAEPSRRSSEPRF